MAIAARLSRTLRETLGEEGADDLVNWMVQVESNRSELNGVMEAWKVTTDARFAEFGVRMDLRFAEQDHRMEVRFAEQDHRMEVRFAEQDHKIDLRFTEH